MIAKLKSIRQSNIELLRILSMFFVLIGHVNGLIIGLPNKETFSTDFLSSSMHVLVQGISVVGVNVFVLISGWFGIKATFKGGGKFVFQFLFLLLAIYGLALITGHAVFNISGIKNSLGLTEEYWFVMAYLGMFIFTPILNAYVEQASQVQFRNLLISFYVFQCYYCWISGFTSYFEGYSVVFFCGLYLTARYVRLYPLSFLYLNSSKLYLGISIFISLIASLGIYFFGNAMRMLRYDNPLVILSSLALLLAFSKIKFQRNYVNVIAQSSFAVYIIHFNPYVFPFFKQVVRELCMQFSGVSLIGMLFIFLVVVFLVCVVIDQVRIGMWRFCNKLI